MSTYLVTRRVNEDRVYLPGELLVDPPFAGVLMARGYLVPVPDNFVAPRAVAENTGRSKHKLPKTVDLSVASES
jgi:hypothetical protein